MKPWGVSWTMGVCGDGHKNNNDDDDDENLIEIWRANYDNDEIQRGKI